MRPSLTLFELPISGIAKRWQHVAVGVSPRETGKNRNLSREAAAEISARPIAAAASRLTTLFSFTFCGLSPAATCGRRFAAKTRNFKTYASGYDKNYQLVPLPIVQESKNRLALMERESWW
jgi:hypothetical protein